MADNADINAVLSNSLSPGTLCFMFMLEKSFACLDTCRLACQSYTAYRILYTVYRIPCASYHGFPYFHNHPTPLASPLRPRLGLALSLAMFKFLFISFFHRDVYLVFGHPPCFLLSIDCLLLTLITLLHRCHDSKWCRAAARPGCRE